MNIGWRKSISNQLSKRRIDNNVDFDNTNDIEEKIILPTLMEIRHELKNWYDIHSVIKENELMIQYGESGCWYKFSVSINERSKALISVSMIDLNDPELEPGIQPTLHNSFSKEFNLKEINSEIIGNVFTETFVSISKIF